eukprot:44034_1
MTNILNTGPKPPPKQQEQQDKPDSKEQEANQNEDDTNDNAENKPDTTAHKEAPSEQKDDPYPYQATLWKLVGDDASDELQSNALDNLHDDDFNINNAKNLKLQPMFTLPTRSSLLGRNTQISTHRVLWDPLGVESHVMSLGENCIQFWKFADQYSAIKEDKCVYDEERLKRLTHGCWDPHYPNRFISTNDKTIRVWEAKSLKEIQTIENAHKACILSVDHNPNKPYHIVTSSEDRTIKFWDLRNSEKPLKVLSNHSHWIWSVCYNRYHDQLIISSGSDAIVSLWNIVSVSSAPLGELDDNSKEEDKLIKTYKEHEESVYCSSWSANNAWVFASLSYDGRVVINHVPAATKYKILL